ncbi:hypothetical protein Taro_043111 [Colocasia esculenta]|uniref:Uncharacterized protein n=1 Tax=Colocasia esculenta TaxID=4460 RepID=A0A843WFK9_COLES|nr:hypothetical protein [Colocasia esculenta]
MGEASTASSVAFSGVWWFVRRGPCEDGVRSVGAPATRCSSHSSGSFSSLVVRRLLQNTSSIEYPRFCVSQARVFCCARGVSQYGVYHRVPHLRELGPESLKVPGMDLQLCGLQSVAMRLRGGSCAMLFELDAGIMNQ